MKHECSFSLNEMVDWMFRKQVKCEMSQDVPLAHKPASHPSPSGGCRNAFPGLALEMSRPFSLENGGRWGEGWVHGTVSPPLFFKSIPQPLPHLSAPCPLQTEASPPHPRSGPWDEFSRLLILLGRVSFQPGSGILQENNIESSCNLCQHLHNDITVMHVPGSRSGLCVLLIYPSNNLMK